MKKLLVLLLVAALGFTIYKKNARIADLTAQTEECERKIGQLEAELNHLKGAPAHGAPALNPSALRGSALGVPANGEAAPTPTPAPSPAGDWMWKPTIMDAPRDKKSAR